MSRYVSTYVNVEFGVECDDTTKEKYETWLKAVHMYTKTMTLMFAALYLKAIPGVARKDLYGTIINHVANAQADLILCAKDTIVNLGNNNTIFIRGFSSITFHAMMIQQWRDTLSTRLKGKLGDRIEYFTSGAPQNLAAQLSWS